MPDKSNLNRHVNYISLPNNCYKEVYDEIGWIRQNDTWFADYAHKLEWYIKEDGFWEQRYKQR